MLKSKINIEILLLSLLLLLLPSCKKDDYDVMDYGYAVRGYFNGNYVALDNLKGDERAQTGDYTDCNFISIYPYEVESQIIDSLCVLRYTSKLISTNAQMMVTFTYKVAVDTSLLKLNTNGIYIHKYNDLIAHFHPQFVTYAADGDDLGIVIEVYYFNSMLRYSTLNYPDSNITNDIRYGFQFIKDKENITPTNIYPYAPTYVSATRGVFGCLLYSDIGDTLIITNGEFRLPFCE